MDFFMIYMIGVLMGMLIMDFLWARKLGIIMPVMRLIKYRCTRAFIKLWRH